MMRAILVASLLLAGCGLHERAVDNAHDVAQAAAAAATNAGDDAGWAIEKSQRTAVEAVTLARKQGARVELTLHGAPDPSNPKAVAALFAPCAVKVP